MFIDKVYQLHAALTIYQHKITRDFTLQITHSHIAKINNYITMIATQDMKFDTSKWCKLMVMALALSDGVNTIWHLTKLELILGKLA